MGNLNKVIIMGNLTKDPELRHTPGGIPVCNIRLAINRFFKSKEGENKKEACFVNIVAWSRQAELCQQYLHKGSPLLVEGRLSSKQWEGSDGQKKTSMEVVASHIQFVGPKNGSPASQKAFEEDHVAEEGSVLAGAKSDKEEIPF